MGRSHCEQRPSTCNGLRCAVSHPFEHGDLGGCHSFRHRNERDDLWLKGSTGYDIQVRSVSDEGESDWVAVVGTTEGASPPTILSPGPFNVSENQVYVTELKARATLGQALSWSLAGGEDQSLFLLTKSGKLFFSSPKL